MTRKPCGSLSLAAQVQPLARRAPGIAGRRAPTNGGQGLAPHSEHGVRADTALPCGSTHSLACEKPALFSPMFYSPAFTFSSVYSLGFGFLAGLCLLVLRQFSAFLQAVRCLGGTMFFRGLRPSSIWGFPFWLLGLTGQSSRPAFGGRLTFVR